MRIGILQCGHFPTPDAHPKTNYSALYTRLLDGFGFEFQTWSVVDMAFPSSPHDADGWLLSGSKYGAYDDVPFIASLEQLIRDIYAANIIAQALGGTVTKRVDGWNCKRNTYTFADTQKNLMAWHQDEVTALPADVAAFGSSPQCAFAEIRYQGNAMSMQPHPEFDDDIACLLMDSASAESLTVAQLDGVRAGLGTPHDNATAA
ncbi:unnamed protein product, partial [Ectocarpus sp. 12 AP-2014]